MQVNCGDLFLTMSPIHQHLSKDHVELPHSDTFVISYAAG